MKWMKYFLSLFSIVTCLTVFGQGAKEDTTFVNDLLQKGKSIMNDDPAKAIALAEQALEISKKINFLKGQAYAFKNIGIVYYVQGKYIETLNYWNQSLQIFEKQKDEIGISNILNNMGAIYFNQGDDAKALDYSLRSLQIAEKTGDKLRIMSALGQIGSIYHNKQDPKALSYLLKALPLCQDLGDKGGFGVIAGNIGEIYFDQGDYNKALEFYQKAINVDKNSTSSAFAYIGIGKVYQRKGNFALALNNHRRAMALSEKLDDKMQKMRAMKGIANVYSQQGKYTEALDYYKTAKALGEEVNANVELKDLYLEMATAYSTVNDYKNAFLYKSLYADVKDTLYNVETAKKLGKLQFDFDLNKKQGEINLLTKDKKLNEVELKRQRFAKTTLAIGLILLLIIAFVIYGNYRRKLKMNRKLDKQKDEIEHLLLNILPSEVAKELQITGYSTPRQYESVSVLFTDFENFSAIADKLTPGQLIEELNRCFIAFDNIVEKYGLEKIKTIGDSYMCAGGIPKLDENHVYKIVKAGVEMQDFVKEYNDQCKILGRDCWGMRVGIHVGPLVSGVVGKKKYAYDIWGNTVNVASRMESNGEPGRVNISNKVYEIIKDKFSCSYRGKIHAKNVGEIDMYFLEEEIAGASSDGINADSSSETTMVA
jgi:adenylate cyclase